MIAQERMERVTALVARRQKVTVAELLVELGVSPATLRRDLARLEARGEVVRVHGAVVHPHFLSGEPSLEQKASEARGINDSMARAVADLIPARSRVFVDAGTSCLAAGSLLLARRDLTILTSSIPLAARASPRERGACVLLLGGEVRALTGALTGALTQSWMENLRADWAIVGASGLDRDGASTTELSEAATKSAFVARSGTRVLLADARKWDAPASVRFAAWSDFEFWVTGGAWSEEDRRALDGLGPRVITCVEP